MTEPREYRGKRIDNGEWVEGFYVETGTEYHGGGKPLIGFNGSRMDFIWLEFVQVDPNTVGQYTGLTDKNGTKIFEGDVVKWDSKEWGSEYAEVVKWDYEIFTIRESAWKEFCEVIGNIHDATEGVAE